MFFQPLKAPGVLKTGDVISGAGLIMSLAFTGEERLSSPKVCFLAVCSIPGLLSVPFVSLILVNFDFLLRMVFGKAIFELRDNTGWVGSLPCWSKLIMSPIGIGSLTAHVHEFGVSSEDVILFQAFVLLKLSSMLQKPSGKRGFPKLPGGLIFSDKIFFQQFGVLQLGRKNQSNVRTVKAQRCLLDVESVSSFHSFLHWKRPKDHYLCTLGHLRGAYCARARPHVPWPFVFPGLRSKIINPC